MEEEQKGTSVRGRPKGRGRVPVNPNVPATEQGAETPVEIDPAILEEAKAVGPPGGSEGEEGASEQQVPKSSTRGREGKAFLYTRPNTQDFTKVGTSGHPVNVVANYFQMQKKQSFKLFQYRVDIEPPKEEYKDNPRMIKKVFSQFRETLPLYIFDGSLLFCQQLFPENPWRLPGKDRDDDIVAVIKLTKELDGEDNGMNQFHNIILRSILNGMNLTLMGRHYYDPDGCISKPNYRLELWPGYITSLRTCDGDALLNVEVTHKVIRTDSVLQLLNIIRNDMANAPMQERNRKMEEAISGRIVMTKYNNKTYKIKSMDFETTPNSTFQRRVKKGAEFVTEDVSYIDYYKIKYPSDSEIQFGRQPMLVAEPSKRDIHREESDKKILLVPELCFITGLDEEQRANFHLTRDLSDQLHMAPGNRVNAVRQLMQRVMRTETIANDLAKWGVRFNPEPVRLQGRLLPQEKLIVSNGGQMAEMATPGGDWTKEMRNVQMLSSLELKKWVVIVPVRSSDGIDNLLQLLQRVGTPLGMRIGTPEIIRIPNPSSESYIRACDDVMKSKNGDIQLFFVILAHNRIDLYSAIKKRISIDYGIISQCFLAKNLSNKGLMSICTKVAIQMNAKLGGEPWGANNPLKSQEMMVVGFDVYHSAGSGSSIGCMVATMKSTMAKFYSTVVKLNTKQEVSHKIAIPFAQCLKAYSITNNCLPTRIMFYRDGVGEGQLDEVYNTELKQIMNQLESRYGKDKMPKFTFIVVSKRINTRFFTAQGGAYINPQPGTLVDTVVTFPERYDFYVVAQSVRQGTVSPTSYNVLSDTSLLGADKIQIFTYKLCHMYFNWSGTVAVPAPCQYAHKLAYLTGLALQRPANNRLDFLLHYL